jgi:ribonucleoside-diphosphate reductase alpha chain
MSTLQVPNLDVRDTIAASTATSSTVAPFRPRAERHRLPTERSSVTHRFSVGGHKGYFTVGLYPDGEPGELFITMAKEGSSVSGLMSSFAQVVSVALQHGVPLTVFCDKFTHTRFEPSGFTGNPEIPIATSIMDYIFRWLQLRFLSKPSALPRPHQAQLPERTPPSVIDSTQHSSVVAAADTTDAPFCVHCGSLTVRSGACFLCQNCGNSSGCG